MSYNIDTGALLDAARTAAGASVTAGAFTYTWARKVEGPALRWLDVLTEYPALVMEVGEPQVVDQGRQKEHISLLTVTAIIKLDLDPADLPYQQTREMGEALLNSLMSAAARIGNMRQLVSYGVDTETMGIEHYAEQGFGIYVIALEVSCFVEDDNP